MLRSALATLKPSSFVRLGSRAFANAAGVPFLQRCTTWAGLACFFGAVGAGTYLTSRTGGIVRYSSVPIKPKKDRPRLVILGTGWAAMQCLKTVNTSLYDVVVISPRNHFTFSPLLTSTAVGTIESRSVIEPLRRFVHVWKKDIHYYQAKCIDIDPKSKKITCVPDHKRVMSESEFYLGYDKLVVACGAVNNTFGVKGVKEHCYFIKEVDGARKVRSRLMDLIEAASLPGMPREERRRLLNVVVVGGGPTGVEFAGELHDYFANEVRNCFPHLKNDVKISLIQSADTLLCSFDRKLRKYAEKTLKKLNVDLRTNCRVTEVAKNHIMIKDKKTGKKEDIHCGLIVWSTGNAPRELSTKLIQVLGQKGKNLEINPETLECHPDIYALGDCSSNENRPATAQMASQQGKFLGKALNQLISKPGKPLPKFKYQYKGAMCYAGDSSSVIDFPYGTMTGFLSYLTWRFFYWSQQLSHRNKILIGLDWAKTAVFGRDLGRYSD